MRASLLGLLLFTACGRPPEPPPRAVPPPAPDAPVAEKDRVAFVRRGEVWTMAADGSGSRSLVKLEGIRIADPAWSPDRKWIAFSAAADPDFNLHRRNLFVARADGSERRQVTPMPRSGASLEDEPKGPVRGRAVAVTAVEGTRRPLQGMRVTAFGMRRAAETDALGYFNLVVPAGPAWVKVSGDVDGARASGWRLAAATEGRVTDLGDILVSPGEGDEAASPAWSADSARLVYLLRRSLVGRRDVTGAVTLRWIRTDGSGDDTLHIPARATVIAGPVVRGGSAWLKFSDGQVVRIELETRRAAESFDAGVSVPDALAVAPDGKSCVTLRMDASGAPALVRPRPGGVDVLHGFGPGDALPHAMDFAPDGSAIVMDRRGDGKSDLWRFDLTAKAFTRLTDDGDSSEPVWNGR